MWWCVIEIHVRHSMSLYKVGSHSGDSLFALMTLVLAQVLVFGSIKVCRRILFLNEHNITVLGGKVLDLLETNKQTNILAAAL